jgi:hypothetical protein
MPAAVKDNSDAATEEVECFQSRAAYHLYFDEILLENAWIYWQFGDWENLEKLDCDTLQHHPDRAKLALLAAAGQLQTGNSEVARKLLCHALDLGCSKQLISQILISGVHNSIGCAAAAIGNQQRALKHFESAIGAVASSSQIPLLAKARMTRQYQRLGLPDGSDDRPQAIAKLSLKPDGCETAPAVPIPPAKAASLVFNRQINRNAENGNNTPFLLLESKSLPRSGLHYLKKNLSSLLGDHFSFCEWYQEPGCCKKMPCALTGYAIYAQETGEFRLRLTKSHDFKLTDPVLEVGQRLRRLVLLREPLFVLTSWFSLWQLEFHKVILEQGGINIQKIWLAHEKEILPPAYKLLNINFKEPTTNQLSNWLSEKVKYITAFINKWVTPALEQPNPYIYIVRYEEIDLFTTKIITEFSNNISESARDKIIKFAQQSNSEFKNRKNPFDAPAERLASYLQENSLLFKEAAARCPPPPMTRQASS